MLFRSTHVSRVTQGYVNGSTATRAVLGVADKCSKDVDCLFPDGASGRNHRCDVMHTSHWTVTRRSCIVSHTSHRWDQSVFTSLLHLAGMHTHTLLRFWAKLCNADMQVCGSVSLCLSVHVCECVYIALLVPAVQRHHAGAPAAAADARGAARRADYDEEPVCVCEGLGI